MPLFLPYAVIVRSVVMSLKNEHSSWVMIKVGKAVSGWLLFISGEDLKEVLLLLVLVDVALGFGVGVSVGSFVLEEEVCGGCLGLLFDLELFGELFW